MKEEIKKILEPYHNEMAEIVRRNRMALWTIIGGVVLMIVAWAVLFALMMMDKISGNVIVIGVLIAAGIGFIIILIGTYLQRKMRRSFSSDFITNDEKTVYALYESYLKDRQKTTSIVKDELGQTADGKTVASFFFKNELFNYLFETRTWKEVHRRSGFMNGRNRYRNYVIYYVQYIFRKKALGANAQEGTLVAELNTDSAMNHKSDFESESIAFNKMFNVNGKDILSITKLFNPKVIDQMVNIGAEPFKKRSVKVMNNSASISFSKSNNNRNPHFALSDFDMLKYSVDGIINGIIAKIERDMGLFMELRHALSAFDFGQE